MTCQAYDKENDRGGHDNQTENTGQDQGAKDHASYAAGRWIMTRPREHDAGGNRGQHHDRKSNGYEGRDRSLGGSGKTRKKYRCKTQSAENCQANQPATRSLGIPPYVAIERGSPAARRHAVSSAFQRTTTWSPWRI